MSKFINVGGWERGDVYLAPKRMYINRKNENEN